MKKFGFGSKKDKDSSKSSSPAQSNPYAAAPPPAEDPYADVNNKFANMSPYQQQKAQVYGGGAGIPGGPRAGAPSPSPAAPARSPGYGADRFGNGGGYGSNRYEGAAEPAAPARGPGGYGGLGRDSIDTTTTDDAKNALFGGAKDRYAQRGPPPPNSQEQSAYGAPSRGNSYQGYGEERQLTEEEQEEEDVQATKQSIRDMKRQDVSSTQNALRIAAMAEETGRATLARLGAQGDRLYNTEKNLDLAANHNRIAEEKARELKTLNGSMFAVHVSNPFTSNSRKKERDEEIIRKHREEREQREETRRKAFQGQQQVEGAFRSIGEAGYKPPTKASLAERSRFQFEADSEDDEMENEIDANLDALGGAASRLNKLARATGEEVERQNTIIDGITRKTDRVGEGIVSNSARLARIN